MSETLETVDVTRIETLRHAAELVERGWTKGNMALDSMGDAIDPLDFRACAFCVHGALVVAARKFHPDMSLTILWEEVEAINETIIELGLIPDDLNNYGANAVVHQWNDEAFRMKIDVVETLRKAADKLSAGAL